MSAGREAIISIVIGTKYRDLWLRYARDSWQAYANKFGLELIIFHDYLDPGERARTRSPAWQKLLLLEHPSVAGFDRVVYVDADVVINAHRAPLIFEGVPDARIGATINNSFISHPLLESSFSRTCGPNGPVEYARGLYSECGLSPAWDFVINTGVWVASPRHHASLLRDVYDKYKELPHSYYEQTFLSHQIIANDLFHEINGRFNVMWYEFVDSVYDFLSGPYETVKPAALASVLDKSYFLHFAAEQDDLKYLVLN